MKTKLLLAATLIGAAALTTQAGVGISINLPGPPVPVVAVPVPAPVVVVPDSYVWDGYENVGFINGAYFYLGPGNVWIACGPDQLARFHGYERGHPDWRAHATRNERYRGGDARGHAEPMRSEPNRDRGSDRDRDRDHR